MRITAVAGDLQLEVDLGPVSPSPDLITMILSSTLAEVRRHNAIEGILEPDDD